ncbi:matrix metalloproteinase-19-like [Oncorhynchus masou masou]|uniref:matrix metalloproteinase-19-like n=1 Tax=Oncorhynchus masou masou TaxID=90313 RepID=UPI00318449F9
MAICTLHWILRTRASRKRMVFQRVTDLPVTGVIDKATLEMMRQSRCGIEDPFNQKTLKLLAQEKPDLVHLQLHSRRAEE